MNKRSPQSLRFNAEHPGLVRDESRDGTMFLVVPVVMLQEQILFCSNCHPDGEFVSAAEIISSLAAWNNRPVTLSHPTMEWTPSNHKRLEVGRVFNAFWDGKLKAEMWLDLNALRRTSEGKAVEANFREGKIQEVSTGYFVDRTVRAGKFQGQSFAIVQNEIVPDHLAILTNEVGACSVEGGCGAPRLNSNEGDSMDGETMLARGLKTLLKVLGKGAESTDGTAGNEGGETPSSAAGNDDGGSGEESSDGSTSMGKKEKAALVKSILDSKKVETFDEKALLAMTDEQLKSLATLAGCSCNDGEGGDDGGDGDGDGSSANAGEGDGEGKKKKEPAANAEGGDADGGEGKGKKKEPAANAAPTIDPEDQKFLTALRAAGGDSVDGLIALMEAGKVEAARRETLKSDLVKQLNKDEKVAMSEAVLNSMSLEALEGLDRSLNPTNYAGRGGARIDNSGSDEEHFAPDPLPIVLADADGTKSDGDDTGGES